MLGDKINKKSNIASIVELFMMFLLLLVVIVVLTMVCMTTREQSLDAGDLTKAVICAENTAEITKDAANPSEAAALLKQMDGISDIKVTEDTVTATQNGYRIEVALAPEEGASGTYVDETIKIYADDDSLLYQLHTGSYLKEGSR